MIIENLGHRSTRRVPRYYYYYHYCSIGRWLATVAKGKSRELLGS